MKKKIFKTSLLGASSIMGALVSCENNNIEAPESNNEDYPIMSRNVEKGTIAVSLPDDTGQYLITFQKIADDILNYPELANEFIKDPQQFFHQYGYNGNISLDDGYIRFLTAYADNEIRDAIKNRDLKSMIRLCREKKIFDNASSKTKLTESFKKSLKEKKYDSQVEPYGWFWFVEWVALASAYAGFNAAFNFETYTSINTEGIVSSLSNENSSIDVKLLWNIITDEDPVKFITQDNYQEIANEIFITLKELRSDLFEKFSEEEVLNQITASLYGCIL